MKTSPILRSALAALLIAAPLVACAYRATAPSGGPAAIVERLDVIDRKPAFGGMRVGEAGEVEMVAAVAHMRVDPKHAASRQIADLAGAAEADRAVRCRTDVAIVRPHESTQASRVVVFDIANRGASGTLRPCVRQRDAVPRAEPGVTARAARTERDSRGRRARAMDRGGVSLPNLAAK